MPLRDQQGAALFLPMLHMKIAGGEEGLSFLALARGLPSSEGLISPGLVWGASDTQIHPSLDGAYC